jgi:hypothetical protein
LDHRLLATTGGDQSLTFTSQHGIVRVDSLPQVFGSGPAGGFDQVGSVPAPASPPAWRAPEQPVAEKSQVAGRDIFGSIERLAGLRDKGFISEEEFSAKKTELLKRL